MVLQTPPARRAGALTSILKRGCMSMRRTTWTRTPLGRFVTGLGGAQTNGQCCGGKSSHPPVWMRRGRLKNGNAPGDLSKAPRCGARTRKGLPCGSPAMRGRNRCWMHGGRPTGPRTAAGLVRSKQARWKHGRFSEEARREVSRFSRLLRECKEMERLLA